VSEVIIDVVNRDKYRKFNVGEQKSEFAQAEEKKARDKYDRMKRQAFHLIKGQRVQVFRMM